MTSTSKMKAIVTSYLALDSNLRALLMTSIIRNLGISLWEPLLGLYLTGDIGVSLIIFGVMTTIRQLVSSIASFPSGFLSDNVGRKTMIMISLACSMVALGTLLVTTHLPQLFVVSIFRGLSTAFLGPSKSAYVIDMIPDERRGVAFSTIAFFESLSNIIAVSLSGVIATVAGFPTVFSTALVLEALALLSTIIYLREPSSKALTEEYTHELIPKNTVWTQLKNGLTLLRSPPFLAVLMGIVFHQLGLGIEGPYLTIYARDLLLFSLPIISVMLGVQRFGILLGQFPSGRLVDKYGGEIAFAFHIFVTSPVMILFTIMGQPLLASVILFSWGLTFGLDTVSRQKLVGTYRAASGVATAFGIIGLVSGGLSLITPTVGSWVWTNFSPQWVFYAAAAANVLGAIALLMLWVYRKRTIKEL
ncbi:MAG: MFS transporter [Candidatus Bathyarchaeota archaeon]|nr:MFS transporter [Candidatus Bathyarchaeota archaeon]